MDGRILRRFLECVDPTQNGNLASKPLGAVMIRKCYSREASTFSLLYWNRPISMLIFSGAIVLTAPTIESVPWIQGKEKCVMHLHKFLPVWSRPQVTDQRGCKICAVIDCGLHFCVAVHVCMKTASSPIQKHNDLPVEIGNLSRLSGNKQWPVDNGSLVLLSSSCSYIRATGMPMVCHSTVEVAIWSIKNVWCILVNVRI